RSRRCVSCSKAPESKRGCVMKCTDLLMQDHKIILQCLNILDDMASRVQNEQPVEIEDAHAILRFLRVFADDHHQTKEESALFPELRRVATGQDQPWRRLMFGQARVCAHV